MIILAILKGIGLVLLGIILAILIVLICLLFVPIRYGIKGEILEEHNISFYIHSWFHFFQWNACYSRDGFSHKFSILGKKIVLYPKKKKQPKAKQQTEHKTVIKDTDSINTEIKNTEIKNTEIKNTDSKEIETRETIEKEIAEKETSRKNFFKKKTSHKDTKKENKNLSIHKCIPIFMEELCYLIKHVAPKKLEGEGIFSMGSPDITGQVTGVLSMWPVIYGKNKSFLPDFESDIPYFKGWIRLSGYVASVRFLIILFRLWKNPIIKENILKK